MKRKILLFLVISLSIIQEVNAQKPALDTGVLYRWPTVTDGFLSSNGRYAGYTILEQPVNGKTIVLKDTKSNWEQIWINADRAVFTSDSRQAIVQRKDTVRIAQLGSNQQEVLPAVSSFKFISQDNNEILAYLTKTNQKNLVFRSMKTGKADTVKNVDDWLPMADGKHLLLKRTTADGTHQLVELTGPEKHEHLLWEGKAAIAGWLVDPTGELFAFMPQDTRGDKEIWYGNITDPRPRKLADNNSPGLDTGMVINNINGFSKDKTRLIFSVNERPVTKTNSVNVSVDVWSYTDPLLQSQQLFNLKYAQSYLYFASVDLKKDGKVRQVLHRGEQQATFKDELPYLVITTIKGDRSERPWSSASQFQYEVVEMNSGNRTPLDLNPNRYVDQFTTSGRYLLLTDFNTTDISSYDLNTGKITPLTQALLLPQTPPEYDQIQYKSFRGLKYIGSLPEDKAIIVSDIYDLWEIDPQNKKPPINLTGRYGSEHRIKFELALEYKNGTITGDELILTGFNKKNKEQGFFKIRLHREQIPVYLSMGAYFWSSRILPIDATDITGRYSQAPIKAVNTENYLLMRQSAEESPNYFVTSDFRSFSPVSSVYPEKNYQWLQTRLINFKTEDGQDDQGILYLPKNADVDKKYPLIFNYYEARADQLHSYPVPQGPNGQLNIPWFVSHGYGVFVPEMHFAIGKTGESAVNTIDGAVRALKLIPQIDTTKMGLQGHSFAGEITMFLITHSQKFVAAIASSGIADLTAYYGDVWGAGNSRDGYMRVGQGRMVVPPWEDPQRYILNSPIFFADKTTAPVLLVSNHMDTNVPFSQGVEMFTALRRLGKPAWMLQYDHGGHGVFGEDRMDYLIRSTQFFDHYLKGAPAPVWMTQGIPASKKGQTLGYELDTLHPDPGPGLLLPEKQNH